MKKIYLASFFLTIISCGTKVEKKETSKVKTIAVNPSYFIQDSFIKKVTKEVRNINGLEISCYVFTTKSTPSEHEMGPWCPKNINEGKEKGGLWFKDGEVYGVDGHFIANLKEFYNDDKWNLVREDGSIKYTATKEACLGAAKPRVEEAYKNHCVECLPNYFEHQETTFIIPAEPVYYDEIHRLKRGGLGVALNGVKFDPPAPVHAILAAHTIAPLDKQGGHVNPHGGYHYHAATGFTKEIKQDDAHAPLIGYAIDGFGIYTHLNANKELPKDLDECGGHIDDVRGYHYHAGSAGSNEVIKCFRGNPGSVSVKE